MEQQKGLLSMEKLPTYLHGKKASEVFMEYSSPCVNILAEEMGRAANIIELEKILRLPWYIWNKVIAESDSKDRLKGLLQQVRNIYRYNMAPGAEQLMQDLEERKRTTFKLYKYYLVEYKVYKKNNGELMVSLQHASVS